MENEIEKMGYESLNGRKNGCLIWTIVGLVIIILGLCTIGYLGTDKVTSYFKDSKSEKVECYEDENLFPTEKEPTVQDIIEQRTSTKMERRIDSVYMAIPDFELAAILMNIGTTSTKEAIVYEYELHRKLYEDVKLGAEIQKKIIQRHDTVIPKDSILILRQIYFENYVL